MRVRMVVPGGQGDPHARRSWLPRGDRRKSTRRRSQIRGVPHEWRRQSLIRVSFMARARCGSPSTARKECPSARV